jgi:lysophospholipase L1-like esterase
LRILVFGDSVVNGGSQTDQGNLATSLLANNFKSSTGQSIYVGNVSAGEWGPGNWLAYVRAYEFFGADAVVLVISSHDASDNPTFAPLNPLTHPQRPPFSALWEGVTRYLPRYLPQSSGKYPVSHAVSMDATANDAGFQQGVADLDAFLARAQAQTPNVLVVQHPERRELESGAFRREHAAIQAVAARRRISVAQFSPALKRAFAAGEMPYRDNIHINDRGQRELAQLLEDWLGNL